MGKGILKSWEPLRQGDIVDIVAPGFSTTDDKVVGAIDFVKNLGLVPRLPENLFGPDPVCGNSDAIRLAHLKKAFFAKDSRAVWCLRAGYGMIRLIEEFAKFKRPKQNKLFIGYSDATTFHNYINQFWKYQTLHGPLLDKLGQHTLNPSDVAELIDIIFGRKDKIIFEDLEPLNEIAKKNKKIKGSLVGGNLTVTQSHLGTKFQKNPSGQFLFFEDLGERGYRVDRILKQMEMAGYFKNISGVVFGNFSEDLEPGRAPSKVPGVLKRFAENSNFAVFQGLESGHGVRQRPLPFGAQATLVCGPRAYLEIEL